MSSQARESLSLPESLRSPHDLPIEERNRRGYLALCLLVMLPILLGFAAEDVVQGRFGEAFRGLVVAASHFVTLLLLPSRKRIWTVFRVALAFTLALVLHQLASGASDGVGFLWLYSIPLLVFFIFGKREGGIWLTALGAALAVLFFADLGTHSYDPPVVARFLATFAVVSLMAYGVEAYRFRYYQELLKEKAALEDALSKVRELRGLLAICAWCKRARDDDGSWNPIETHLSLYSEAEPRAATCPDCRLDPPAEATV